MIFVQLSSSMLVYQRKVYTILDMFGDLGGFLKITMLFAHVLVAGYGAMNFKIHMVSSSFKRRDRTLTFPKHLWSKPLTKHSVSELAFQLQTTSLNVPTFFGCKSFFLSFISNKVF
jgi:hypothetical protein